MKSAKTKIWGGLLVLALTFALTSRADDETKAGQSTAQASSFYSTLKEKVTATYFGQFMGPSLGAPSRLQNDGWDKAVNDSDHDIQLYNSFGLGYKFAPDWAAGTSIRSEWRMTTGQGQDLTLLDPRPYVSRANIINANGWNLKGVFYVEAPASLASQKKGTIAAPTLYTELFYTPPGSRLTVGTYAWFRTYFYSKSGTSRDLRAYIGPNASYKLSRTVAATLLWELEAERKRGQAINEWDNNAQDLQPGIAWDITDKWNVNPYLNMFPGGRFLSADNIGLGVYISGSFL